MKIGLPRREYKYNDKGKLKFTRRVNIDAGIFTSRFLVHHTYMIYWQKPSGEMYIKFCQSKPMVSEYPNKIYDLPVGGCNTYGHRLLKIENCYVVG